MFEKIKSALAWLSQWYSSSEARPDTGRNDPCWCGSGRKYKHCHMRADMRKGTLTKNVTPNQKEMMSRAQKRMDAAKAKKKK
jgi:hypothetical protein